MLEAQAAQFDKDVAGASNFSYIKCGFEVEFASERNRQDVARFMRDFTGRHPISVSSSYGASQGGSYDGFGVENDTSIGTDKQYRVPVEIVSPILGFDEMLYMLERTLDMVAKIGRTDRSTGLHISFSRNDVHLQQANFDPLKLLLFLGEHYWAQVFGREHSSFAAQMLSSLVHTVKQFVVRTKKVVTYKDCFDIVEKLSSEGFLTISRQDRDDNDLAHEIVRAIRRMGRRSTVNLTHLFETKSDRVEFRLMGGYGYHHKFDKIAALSKRFAYALWASCSDQADQYKEEYARKLYRLFRDTAGHPTATEERVSTAQRLRPEGYNKEEKQYNFKIETLYKYKGQDGPHNIDSDANLGLDKAGRVTELKLMYGDGTSVNNTFAAFRDGKLKDTNGRPLGIADYVYALQLKHGDDSMVEPFLVWLYGGSFNDRLKNGKQWPTMEDLLPKIHSFEPVLVTKYGKLGARQMARIVSYIMVTDLIGWLRGGGATSDLNDSGAVMRAFKSNDFSEIKKNIDIFNEYFARYSKFMDPGQDLSALQALVKSASQYADDIKNSVNHNRSIISASLTVSYIQLPVVFAIQRALGRNDLATVTIMRYIVNAEQAPSLIADWSFLDAKVINSSNSTIGLNSYSAADAVKAARNPNSLLAQYCAKANQATLKMFLYENLREISPKTFGATRNDWYVKIGVPAIDKAAAALFKSDLATVAKEPFDPRNLSGWSSKAYVYNFLAKVDASASFDAEALAVTLCRLAASGAELPKNGAMPEVINSLRMRRGFQHALRMGHTLDADIYGIDRVRYLEGLVDEEVSLEFDLSLLNTMYLSGVSEDFLLGYSVASAIVRHVPTAKVGSSLSEKLLRFLHRAGILNETGYETYEVVRQVASPLVAVVLKLDKKSPAVLKAVLPAGYSIGKKRTRA